MKPLNREIDWPSEVSKIAHFQDEVAFRELFNYFYSPLFSFSFSLTGNKELAEDIVSDLMLKIWTNPQKLLKVNNLKTYLYISVKNIALNAVERNKRNAAYLNTLSVEPINTLNPEQELLSKELTAKIEQAIAQVPPKSRMVFVLIRDNECSYAEVADIMEISIKTVDRHLQIALGKIKEFLNF